MENVGELWGFHRCSSIFIDVHGFSIAFLHQHAATGQAVLAGLGVLPTRGLAEEALAQGGTQDALAERVAGALNGLAQPRHKAKPSKVAKKHAKTMRNASTTRRI